jgi:hypothetical protein
LTRIDFTKEEINLPNQGLQHGIEKSLQTYWTNLVMEIERSTKLLYVKLQAPYRILAAKKLQQVLSSSNQNRTTQKRQACIIKGINNKLVIINTDEYTKKFIIS